MWCSREQGAGRREKRAGSREQGEGRREKGEESPGSIYEIPHTPAGGFRMTCFNLRL
jgi:hypothetical protein